MRYIVVGRSNGLMAEVVWENGTLRGDAALLADIESLQRTDEELDRLSTALEFIGRSLDEVHQVIVDDGESPWSLETKPAKARTRHGRSDGLGH